MTMFVRGPHRRCPSVVACALAILFFVSTSGAAQTIETATPFDSTGRVRSVAPSFADRLALRAPAWPVTGVFTEARLYSVSSGGFVLVVDRGQGRLERFPLTEDQRDALRLAIATGMTQAGRMVGEERPTVISAPAGGRFVRNQMLLSALLYGPAVATLTHDASVGAAAYLLTTGGSFFFLANLSKHVNVSRAQTHLATDGAFRGTLMTVGALNAFGVDPSDDGAAISTLVGGIGGSLFGYQLGKRFTDSEAQSATSGSTWLAATSAGVAGTVGLFNDDSNGRAVSATLVAAGALGYPLGLQYPRRAPYAVTAGDANLINLGAILGAGTLGTLVAGSNDPDPHLLGGLLTAGWIGGTVIADRTLIRPVDHTEYEAFMVWLGALAGGLMGGAIPVLSESDNGAFITGSITLGAILGTVGAEHLVAPSRAGQRTSMRTSPRGLKLQLEPQNLALLALGRPGRFSLARLTF